MNHRIFPRTLALAALAIEAAAPQYAADVVRLTLTEAVRLHGKPSPLTHHLLALTYLALGEKNQAKETRAQAVPAKDAPWEDHMLHRLLQPETAAAFGNAQAKVKPKAPWLFE